MRYDKAQNTAALLGTDLLKIASEIGDKAVAKHKSKLIHNLTGNGLIQDLLEFRDRWSLIPDEMKPVDLASKRLLPDALLSWFCESFDLTPILKSGAELEIETKALSRFIVEPPIAPPQATLIRIRVIKPGWKQGKQAILPPHVQVIGSS